MDGTLQVPFRTISFGATSSGILIAPTCHAHTGAQDTGDLLIGLSTGDGEGLPPPHLCSSMMRSFSASGAAR
jgi:hypothetical protein